MARFRLFRSDLFLWFLGIALALQVYISFATPMGGSFEDVAMFRMSSNLMSVPVKAILMRATYDSAGSQWIAAKDLYGRTLAVSVKGSTSEAAKLSVGDVFVAEMEYTPSEKVQHLIRVERVNPIMVFPLIPALGELGRNILLHVPMSMVAFIAFVTGTVYSIMYLVKRNPDYDRSARASSAVGTMFTLLATITGSIWARFSWGTFWNWDPREVSIFILLLVYGGYFMLRALLEESEDKKARIAAVFNIIAMVSAFFLMFVLPRITQSLHPGGAGGEAPIINTSSTPVNTDRTLLNLHWIAVLLFTLVFVWLKDLYTRVLRIEAARMED